MLTLTEKAPAKINLTLDVLAKRQDGYHDLDTVMASVSLYDDIEIRLRESPFEEEAVLTKTNGADLPEGGDNLATRAARLYFERAGIAGIGAEITIEKRIPICAGLGGGSSDAAAVLRALAKHFAENIDLYGLAAELGSDVPYCLRGGVCRCRGRGEILTPLAPFPDCEVVLTVPNIEISTAEAFKKFGGLTPEQKAFARMSDNVFEAALLLPEVSEIKNLMLACGAERASMSGSGPAVFGVFLDEIAAKSAFGKLCGKFPKTYMVKFV